MVTMPTLFTPDATLYRPNFPAAVPIPLGDKLDATTAIPENFYQPTDPDWTNAINRILATGQNVYLHEREAGDGWAISDALIFQAGAAQRIVGDDPGSSFLKIDANFNMAAQAVIDMRAAADAKYAGVSDIGIEFAQPLTATSRSDLNHYPYAIDCSGVFRPRFGGVLRISGAWNGIKAVGDSGGMSADVLDIGAINENFTIDGFADFFSVNFVRVWPHGFEPNSGGSANLLALWAAGVVGCRFGRCDGLEMGTLSGFQARHIFANGISGHSTFGTIAMLLLDGNGSRIEASAGYVNIGSWYKTADASGDQCAVISGGTWTFGGHRLTAPPTGSVPFFAVSGGSVFLASGVVQSGSPDAPVFQVTGTGALEINAEYFTFGANTARTQPFIDVQGGSATIKNPRFTPVGTGSGNAISITNDAAHDITINALQGWNVALPASITNGQYTIDRTFLTTPLVAFDTPGNSSFSYTSQVCQYRLSGNTIFFEIQMLFDTNAFTTAGGMFRVLPNIPYAPRIASAASLHELENVTFTVPFAAEILTDKSVVLRQFVSNASMGNWGTLNIPASKTGIRIQLSGSFIV